MPAPVDIVDVIQHSSRSIERLASKFLGYPILASAHATQRMVAATTHAWFKDLENQRNWPPSMKVILSNLRVCWSS